MTWFIPGRDSAAGLSHRADTGGLLAVATTMLLLVSAALMGGTIVAHLGLLPRGAWGADEYGAFAHFRDHGLGFLWFRFQTWSPRPLSEVLIVLYAWAVTSTGRPLVVPALGICWLGFLASLLTAFANLDRDSAPFRVLGALSIVAFMLLGYHAFQVFYWPFGAVAYLPLLAAALVILFSLGNDNPRAGPAGVATLAILVAAAWSSEAGALLALIYSALMATRMGLSREPGTSLKAAAVRFSLPILAALPVLWLVTHNNRLAIGQPAAGDAGSYHDVFLSLTAAAHRFVYEFLAFDGESFDNKNLIKGALIKLLFFAGVHACWMTRDRAQSKQRRWLPVFALALGITSFGMLAGSYREFGFACCEQHALVRQDLGFLAVAAIAIWLPPIAPVALHWWRVIGPLCLLLAWTWSISFRFADMVRDYRFYAEPDQARQMTWASGASPGPDMTLYQTTPDHLFRALIPGGFHRSSDGGRPADILSFFHKDTVLVTTVSRGQD